MFILIAFFVAHHTEQLKIVFAHIALSDKGNWTCEAADGGLHSKSYDLIVYREYRGAPPNSKNTLEYCQGERFINFALNSSRCNRENYVHRKGHCDDR